MKEWIEKNAPAARAAVARGEPESAGQEALAAWAAEFAARGANAFESGRWDSGPEELAALACACKRALACSRSWEKAAGGKLAPSKRDRARSMALRAFACDAFEMLETEQERARYFELLATGPFCSGDMLKPLGWGSAKSDSLLALAARAAAGLCSDAGAWLDQAMKAGARPDWEKAERSARALPFWSDVMPEADWSARVPQWELAKILLERTSQRFRISAPEMSRRLAMDGLWAACEKWPAPRLSKSAALAAWKKEFGETQEEWEKGWSGRLLAGFAGFCRNIEELSGQKLELAPAQLDRILEHMPSSAVLKLADGAGMLNWELWAGDESQAPASILGYARAIESGQSIERISSPERASWPLACAGQRLAGLRERRKIGSCCRQPARISGRAKL